MNFISSTKTLFATLCLVMASLGSSWAQGVFYSEDFGGSFPTDWTRTEVVGNGQPSANWIYTTTGAAGPFATADIASTTAANGWMIFDSDLNCNDPEGQDAWLISPPINTLGKEDVWLKFQTFFRSFNDRPQVRVGSDMGNLESWATIEVFPGISVNEFGGSVDGNPSLNPQIIQLNLSEWAANQSAVRFAFQFLSSADTQNGGNLTGCGYNWQIDDVELTDIDPRPANDMRVNGFFAVAPNAATPANQLEPFGFIADIANIGSQTQNNVKLVMSITNSGGTEVFRDSLIYGSVASDSTAENVFFEELFLPGTTPDVYTATYSLSLNGVTDTDPSNNLQSFDFLVTDTLFAKELGATTSVAPASDNSFSYGNVFFVPNAGQSARHITFGVANPEDLGGRSVTTFLYKWDGTTPNGRDVEAGSYEIAAVNSYFFTGNEGTDLITIPVDIDGNDIPLDANSYYIAMVQYSADDDVNCFLLGADNYDYSAMNFISDSLDAPRYGAILDVSNTGTLDLLGFGLDLVPVVRLSTTGGTVATIEPQLPDNAVRVFPNPVKDVATLEFNLENNAENVNVKVVDMASRTLQNYSYEHLRNERVQLNVKDLANGTYFVRVRTDFGVRTLKLSVQH